MDINLPGKNALLLSREIREQKNVALIFLTRRDNEVDKILGLAIDADDYITTPSHARELTILARNVLSRTILIIMHPEKTQWIASYLFNGLKLEINSRSLINLSRRDA